jgi:ribose 5-phosphate isomerase B
VRIALGSDHAGYYLKETIKSFLDGKEIAYTDYGTFKLHACDYPEYACKVANAIVIKECDRGILISSSGIGMCITANKIKNIYAVLANDVNTAKLARLYTDANVLCLGGKMIDEQKSLDIVDIWLNTSFEGGRHQRRLNLIVKLTGL